MNKKQNTLRYTTFAIAILTALVVIILCNTLPLPADLACFLVDKSPTEGVNVWAAQNFMWIAFFWGVAELLMRSRILRSQQHELSLQLLPEDSTTILTGKHMGALHQKAVVLKATGTLGRLVCMLSAQFQVSQSVSMCCTILNAEVENRSSEIDLGYNILRYIVWMIPTLGFIGTVWGILKALGTAAKTDPGSPELLPNVISSMSVAFWTTLLALIMSCIIMLFMHIIQGKEEKYLNKCSQYCLKNFINRLYVP